MPPSGEHGSKSGGEAFKMLHAFAEQFLAISLRNTALKAETGDKTLHRGMKTCPVHFVAHFLLLAGVVAVSKVCSPCRNLSGLG